MKTKTKKIFSWSVLVMCIAVFGLVGAVSAEPSVATILNDRYGSGNWVFDSETNIRFTQQTQNAVPIYVDNHSAGYVDPTGWYSTATGSMHLLFAAPTTGNSIQFDPGEEFGLYINSSDSGNPSYYSQQSRNPDNKIHAQLYRITGGSHQGAYVVAFEDKTDWSGTEEPDYNDVVLELTNVNLVPEFATIAIPAIAVLGLFLFFNKRKHKKD